MKKLLPLFILIFSCFASAQVSYDNNAVTGTNSNNATLTIPNLSVPAGNKALVVVLIRNSVNLTPTSVTFNGQSMTLLQTSANLTSRHHIYYRVLGDLAAPVTANSVITMPSAPSIQSAIAFSLKNVDQTTPLTNPGAVLFDNTATTSSTTVAGASGDLAIDAIGAAGNDTNNAPTFAVNSGNQTQIATLTGINFNGFGVRFSVSIKQQTVSPATMAWTVSYPPISTGQGIQSIFNVRAAVPSTAAGVTIGGRVSNSRGTAISGAVVTITGSDGLPRSARSGSFGYFSFDNVQIGETYILNAVRKGYLFAPQVVTVNDPISELNFIANE